MPVNSVLQAKNGVARTKYPLSLKRKNDAFLSNENSSANEEDNNNSEVGQILQSKENNSGKRLRSFSNTYFNTLNAAKKLKTIEETQTAVAKNKLDTRELIVLSKKLKPSDLTTAMLNGHQAEGSQYGGNAGPARKNPIATLSNLGNTCFLNSVLYTLRYAPRFLHNLHHLVSDLTSVEQKLGSMRLKSSSLGRSAAGLASSGTRSWSSKDLLSLGNSDQGKSKIQITTEKLHDTYSNLRTAETKCLNSSSSDPTTEPYAADPFLCALREVNSTFEGNRQQDAHELLVCILDNIRETCRALKARASRVPIYVNGDSNGIGRQPPLDTEGGKLGNLRKSWKKRKDIKAERRSSPTEDRAPTPPDIELDERTSPGWDFVSEDFEGTMVVRTMCLECETVTENKQAMCDICVPVADDGELLPDDDSEPFHSACLSCEYLRDQNKYWCEKCLRYNEARRSVAYSRLPRLLVMQLKRFSGGMEKITRYAPTPLLMSCFCELCVKRGHDQPPPDKYVLWAVIMHLGQTLSGGHYVAYVRDISVDNKCERENLGDATNIHSTGSFMRTLFSRPRPPPTGCAAKDCCVPRRTGESCWLACDDEVVKQISNEEFEDLLSPEPKMRSAATPYLLFYGKSEVG